MKHILAIIRRVCGIVPVRRNRVPNPLADERRAGIDPGRGFVRLVGMGIVSVMMFGVALASSTWFATPDNITITIEGKIGADIKTFSSRADATAAGRDKTGWDAAGTGQDITCSLSSNTCQVHIAVKLDKANPASSTRTLTFGCSTSGYTCGGIPGESLSKQAEFAATSGQYSSASVQVAISDRGTEDTTLSITGTWS